MNPIDFDLETVTADELRGGDSVADTADDFINILKGKGTKAQNSVIYANAALALQTAGKFEELTDAKAAAEEALQTGKAFDILQRLTQN